MQEFIRISAGIPPGLHNHPVSSQEVAPQLVIRGPAGAAERGDQVGKKPGRPRYASEDIRENFSYDNPAPPPPPTEKEDERSASTEVEIMNRNCRQKRGGNYQPPGYSFSASCVLCDKGCLCLGICCLGPKRGPKSSATKRNFCHKSGSIPGLKGEGTLTNVTMPTFTKIEKIEASFTPYPDIFRKRKHNPIQTKTKLPSKPMCKPAPKPSPVPEPELEPQAYHVPVNEWLPGWMRKCGVKRKDFSNKTPRTPSAPIAPSCSMSSSYRKLKVSEEACKKKTKPSTPTMTISPLSSTNSPMTPPVCPSSPISPPSSSPKLAYHPQISSQKSSLFFPSFLSLPSSLHFGLAGGGGQAGRGGKRSNDGRKSESRPTGGDIKSAEEPDSTADESGFEEKIFEDNENTEQVTTTSTTPAAGIPTNEVEWDGVSSDLVVGLSFKTRSQVKKFVAKYGERTNSKLIVTSGGAGDSCTSNKIVWGCTYGHERPSVASEREKVHSKKKNCKAVIRFFCRGGQSDQKLCVLTAFSEVHNHLISRKMFDQDTQKIQTVEEKEMLKDALTMNVKASQIKNMMEKKFKKGSVTTKHVRYMMGQLKPEENESEELATFLEKVEEEGGEVDVKLDDSHKVRCLQVQTVKMRKAYLSVKPDVVNIDTTFNFNTNGYKMTAVCYVNPVTNKGEIAQLVFIADEAKECYEFAFESFKKSVVKDPPTFMVDKDFNEISVLTKVFPNSTILLCQFHVLKWLKSLFSSAKAQDESLPVDHDKKVEIMEAFREVLYAHSDDKCAEKEKQFMEIIDSIDIRVGYGDKAHYVDLLQYYIKNWANCEDMWKTSKRKAIVGLEDENTNNRLERLWRTMKEYLLHMSSGQMSICRAVSMLVKFCEERLEEKYTWDRRHKMRLPHSDPMVKAEYALAAEKLNDRGMIKFKESMEAMLSREGRLDIFMSEDGEEGVKELFKKISKVVEEEFVNEAVEEMFDEVDFDDNEEFDDDFEEGDHTYVKTNRNQSSKVYQTNASKCTCSWSFRAGAPCRHVLFLRKNKGMNMFDITLFNQHFSKERNLDLDRKMEDINLVEDKNEENNNIQVDPDSEIEPEVKPKVLSRNKKFGMINPVAERLVEAILRCGTKRVEQCRDELEICLENVRNGRSLLHLPKEELKLDQDSMDIMEENGENAKEEKPRKKFDLDWQASVKIGKLGRSRQSKVHFKSKEKGSKRKREPSVKKRKVEARVSTLIPTNPIICSYPPSSAQPRQNAVYMEEYLCLRPRMCIPIEVVDFKLRHLQPQGPGGQTVWLMSSVLGHFLSGRWWESPTLMEQLEPARLYQDGGCKIVFLSWCEHMHFFGIVAVCGPQDRMYVMESIGGYKEPKGAAILRHFLRDVRAKNKWAPVDIITTTIEVPKQEVGSMDCGVYLLENAAMILRDPEEFCIRAAQNDLKFWYPRDQVVGRREELALLLKSLGEEQRNHGGIHEDMDLTIPDIYQVKKVILQKKEDLTVPVKKVPSALEVDLQRYRNFMILLHRCASIENTCTNLLIDTIRDFFAKTEKKKPFSSIEIDLFIAKMEEENKLARIEENIFFI